MWPLGYGRPLSLPIWTGVTPRVDQAPPPSASQALRRAARSRAGSVLIAVVIALVIVSIAVAGTVLASGVTAQASLVRMQGARAKYAAEAAANMAVEELMDNVDTDGDGVIGTVSNDGNTANDPTISGTRLWATATTSGGTTTVIGRATNGSADAAVQVDLTSSGNTVAGTVLLVVLNASSLDAQESAKRSLIQGWGYTVTTISETATQAQFDAACNAASCVYISETVNSGNVGTKLTNATLGVVIEEAALSDEFGLSASMTGITTNQITITNASHYITSTLGTGTFTLFSANQPLRYLSGSLGGITTLGVQPSTSNPTLAVVERGATLTPSGAAAGRRVYLPFGNTGMDITQLSSAGQTIMKRSVEWCILPVAWYKLDDASGLTAADAVAGRNGTLGNGPVWTAAGRIGGGLRFDGVDDYVAIANASAFQVTSAMSICGWIKQTGAWPTGSNVCTILRKGDACNVNWQLCIYNGAVSMVLDSCEDASPFYGTTTLPLNTWVHVAGTWDGATVRLYVNGVSNMTPAARAAPIGTDARDVYLGGRIGATDITTGTVDDVRFYNRALTAAEVAAIAAGGKPTVTGWTAVQP